MSVESGGPGPSGPRPPQRAVAGGGERWGPPLARAALFALSAWSLAWPFVTTNPPPTWRFVAAGLVAGGAFLYLAATSWRAPLRSFWGGFALAGLLVVLDSATGSTIFPGGVPAPLVVLAILAFGAQTSRGPRVHPPRE